MFKLFVTFLICLPIYSSGVSKHFKKNQTPTTTNTTPAPVTLPPNPPGTPDSQWKKNRFHPLSKEGKPKEAAVMIGFTFNYVFPTLENNNVAQSSVLPEPKATENEIPKGQEYKLPVNGIPAITVDFAIKPDSSWPSWIWGMDFYYMLQKNINKTMQTKPSAPTNSTYQISYNTFLQDIKHIMTDLSHKLQMVGIYFHKPIFSADYAFFCVGFGGRYLGLQNTRNINYITDAQTACLCLDQDVKGYGIHFYQTIGAFFTDRVGLEMNFEHGILYNRYNLNHASHSNSEVGVKNFANAASTTYDYNTMQRITAFLAFNDWAFSERHIEFKIGLDYLTLEADKLSKTLDTSYTDTKALHLPSFAANFALYF